MSKTNPMEVLEHYGPDEPLGGIDVSVRRKILEGIIKNYSEGALMIISTHLISEIETIIDRALIIKDGKIF